MTSRLARLMRGGAKLRGLSSGAYCAGFVTPRRGPTIKMIRELLRLPRARYRARRRYDISHVLVFSCLFDCVEKFGFDKDGLRKIDSLEKDLILNFKIISYLATFYHGYKILLWLSEIWNLRPFFLSFLAFSLLHYRDPFYWNIPLLNAT